MSRRTLALLLLLATVVGGQTARVRPAPLPYHAPDPASVTSPAADLSLLLDRYSADRRTVQQFHDLPVSATADRSHREFFTAWRSMLDRVDFDKLSPDGRIEYVLFRNHLDREIHDLDLEKKRTEEMSVLLPFAATIVDLREARQRVDPLDPAKAAGTLANLNKQVDELTRWVSRVRPEEIKAKPAVANRASRTVTALREVLRRWYQFYDGYDPMFRWWVADPYKQVDATLEKYAVQLREKLAGLKKDDRDTIIGDPIGRDALLADLRFELVPYTPEELVAIANKEFAWCDAEMLKASRALGFGDDWRRALEHVKTLHMPPGQQPALIRDQVLEAIEYMEKNDLVTVPPLARDTWRMEMMSPERQRVNPFFTGGEVITVSFPTDAMSHEQKQMSLRGNNIHFSRATVFHEVIPGHFLQRFMNERHRPYRRVFRTPFWTEGWALYWEMLLWDHGFPQSPENRIGMLFWRMHRCARIIFSLSFHLEKMTAGECVDFLVNRVGHERENALAEVRRSFETAYEPLYQAAYMLGALQFRALHKEVVGAGKMTNRDFNDAILKMNVMPVEMVRASLTGRPVPKNFTPSWRFYGDPNGATRAGLFQEMSYGY
jgi:uncharacterized protein (DUF885 family)